MILVLIHLLSKASADNSKPFAEMSEQQLKDYIEQLVEEKVTLRLAQLLAQLEQQKIIADNNKTKQTAPPEVEISKKIIPDKVEEKDFEFHGYFRTGSHFLSDGGTINNGSCYSLPFPKNDGLYYRLGNECRDYGEFSFNKFMQVNGIDFKLSWMIDIVGDSRSPTSVESFSRRSRELYVEADNLLPQGKLWIGRRYYRSIGVGDIHILDAFHVQSSGNGFGISNINYGNSTFHFALMGYGADNETGQAITENTFNFQNPLLDIRMEYPLGQYGALKLALQKLFVHEAYDNNQGTDGETYTLQWETNADDWQQKTVFQYGTGSFAENPACFGTNGGCFNFAARSNSEGFRLFHTGNLNLSKYFLLGYNVLYQDSSDYHRVKSLGIRPHYALSKYWSLIAEFGYNQYTANNEEKQQLAKVALGIQATANAFYFWERPALRFYMSNFNWNNAADLSKPGSDDNDALIIGSQVEVWF